MIFPHASTGGGKASAGGDGGKKKKGGEPKAGSGSIKPKPKEARGTPSIPKLAGSTKIVEELVEIADKVKPSLIVVATRIAALTTVLVLATTTSTGTQSDTPTPPQGTLSL